MSLPVFRILSLSLVLVGLQASAAICPPNCWREEDTTTAKTAPSKPTDEVLQIQGMADIYMEQRLGAGSDKLIDWDHVNVTGSRGVFVVVFPLTGRACSFKVFMMNGRVTDASDRSIRCDTAK